ncbi:hypothetical protein N9414_03291 [Nodularia spumigena CCY9414]|nr:hypothetical protein N9414_03291 [Nodularia spumigena CCY9414]
MLTLIKQSDFIDQTRQFQLDSITELINFEATDYLGLIWFHLFYYDV